MGMPAIGTPICGIPDLIIDGKTGFMLPEDLQIPDVANAIMRYAEMSESRKLEMTEVVRQHWEEKFNAKENAVRFAAYLHNLASE